MYLTRTICILGLACGSWACSDLAPTDPISTPLSIVSVSTDSLYWGEQVTIRVNEHIDSTDDVRIFIGSVSSTIDSLRDSAIYITIAEATTTAHLRLYRNDVLATGDRSINILERRYEVQPTIQATSPSPLTGFIGDMIVIMGSNMPLRTRGVTINLGGGSTDIQIIDSNRLTFRVGAQCKSGLVRLFANKDSTLIGEFKLLERGTGDFFLGDLNQAILTTTNLVGSDSLFDRALTVNTLYSNNVRRQGDSLFMNLTRGMSRDSFAFECSLKIHESDNKVSGKIEMVRFSHTKGNPVYRAVIELHEMNWYLRYNDYVIYARGREVSEHLRKFLFYTTGPSPSEVRYVASAPGSVFELRLQPVD